MEFTGSIQKLLLWIPSILIALFFIPNAVEKIFHPHQLGKVITNPALLMGVGIILLAATCLFFITRTMLLGTAILSLYLFTVTLIHIYKGKPYEVAFLIVIATIFAAYLRRPSAFS